MEHYPWILLQLTILLIGVSLLYQWSTTFNFYCKMTFFCGWILILATILCPILAVTKGRNIENMKFGGKCSNDEISLCLWMFSILFGMLVFQYTSLDVEASPLQSVTLQKAGTKSDKGKPYPSTRVLCFCVKPLKYIFGIKITVQGSENLNIQGPYVIVSNHQSCIDLLGMVEVIPDGCVTIAKKELLYLGPIGWAVWLCGLICIDRKKKLEAIATMERIAQTMRQDDMKVWIYPEGTRNEGNTMLPFKRGAFHLALKAQVPLVPIVTSSLKGTYSYKEKRFNPGHWTIRILPKIETKRLRVEDAMELAESTRNLMQDTFYEISRDVCGEKDPRQRESYSHGSL